MSADYSEMLTLKPFSVDAVWQGEIASTVDMRMRSYTSNFSAFLPIVQHAMCE